MSEQCNFCMANFNSKRYLLHHQNSAKYCRSYQNISFVCQKCGFLTQGIKNIDIHLSGCTANLQDQNNICNSSEEYIKKLQKEIKEYKQKLTNHTRVSTLLALEKVKTEIWCKLLELNTNIRTKDIIHETENIVEIYPVKEVDISIFVYKYIQEKCCKSIPSSSNAIDIGINTENIEVLDSKLLESEEDSIHTKKQSYRSIKNHLELVPEKDNLERINLISSVDELLGPKTKNNSSVINLSFDTLFDRIKHNKVFTKIFEDFKNKRLEMLSQLSISDFEKLILDHTSQLTIILKEKSYSEKKINNLVSKSLSALESRLIGFEYQIDSHLEVDDLQIFFNTLQRSIYFPKVFIEYSEEILCKNFYNYAIVLFPLTKLIDCILFNPYEFWNIIYLPLPKSSLVDPYSFYTLERNIKGKRYWKMDCRLEELTGNLCNNLSTYMVSIFRKLYKRVFNDNDFRMNYSSECQLTEGDCEQLLQNILLVNKSKDFCTLLQQKVIQKATYYPTENDKFNLYGDDSLQRKRFHDKDETDSVKILKMLFDDITTEQMVDFYRSRSV